MTLARKLLAIQLPGAVSFRGFETVARARILDIVHAMRDAGHAIVLDETFDTNHVLEELGVYHYRTCRHEACKIRDRKEKP